jgi:5-methylcytosine-specific restriction endonuclease McrA
MKVKNEILKLRKLGWTYKQIQCELKCSKGTISYHCGQGQKEKHNNRLRINRSKQHPLVKKIENFLYDKYVKPTNRKILKNSLNKILRLKIEAFVRIKVGEYTRMTFSINDFIQKFGNNPVCSLTGRPIDLMKPSTYQLDHIIPKSKGGENTLDNCQIVCKEANLAKHNLMTEEFIKLCEEIVNYNKISKNK